MNRNIFFALAAATLFGASTPFARLLVGHHSPVLLAGLLYLGSGVGLTVIRLIRDWGWKTSGLPTADLPWLLGAILFGGVVGPVALMFGLRLTSGSTASLLLNLEVVLTALIAWIVFKEHTSRRMVIGMGAIVAGGVVLAWPTEANTTVGWFGPGLIGLACLCWAIDNNLTRRVSANDAIFIAGIKGIVAGVVNTTLALLLGATLPSVAIGLITMCLGLVGYGLSLVLFVLALRGLGTVRTGAYFSVAPFIGATIAVTTFGESTGWAFWMAALLMAWGIWLHLTEKHEHFHSHFPVEHEHAHVHDAHHQHTHDFPWTGTDSHQHRHSHVFTRHSHPHFPDIHHRHDH